MLRLAAIVPPDAMRVSAMADRLKMSNAETQRLTSWAGASPVHHTTSEAAMAKVAYRGDVVGLRDRLRLALAGARARAALDDGALIEAGGNARLLRFLDAWQRPVFPVKGSDLTALGIQPGPGVGETLRTLEEAWIESGFSMDRESLMEQARSCRS